MFRKRNGAARDPNAELKIYRDLMPEPEEFEDGFGAKTILGALFIGLVMLPGSIYLGLTAGMGIGSAAEWVTIILFVEIARRSLTEMRKQEIYILFYIASGIVGFTAGMSLSGGPFAVLILNQYLVQSPAAEGFGITFPIWMAPPPDSEALLRRTFFHRDWIPAISLLLGGFVLTRALNFVMGYLFFRRCSDYERLPFPLAPIGSMGAMALAESTSKEQTWRWRVFSIGAMIGVTFGVIYVGIPGITGLFFSQPMRIIPIPFVDGMSSTQNFLPATPTGIALDLGIMLTGMVLPFSVIIGGAIATVATTILNPILYNSGVLTTWRPGMGSIMTRFASDVDFYLSFNIGVGFAVAVIGLVKGIARTRGVDERRRERGLPPGRGDFPIAVAIGLAIVLTGIYAWLGHICVPDFPVWVFIVLGFVVTPIQSYINARMIGLAGQQFGFPMLKEATFIYFGKGSTDIWFAPVPEANYGQAAQGFRSIELTGTKFSSIIKAELLLVPVLVLCSLMFWTFIWKLAPIPSAAYPWAQKMWPLAAYQKLLWVTSTAEGESPFFQEALHWKVIVGGTAFGLIGYGVMSFFSLPILIIYGVIRGLGAMPHALPLQLAGALIGRYYFLKKFGEQWRQFVPVLIAGFSCGMGLVGMAVVAIVLIAKSAVQLPF